MRGLALISILSIIAGCSKDPTPVRSTATTTFDINSVAGLRAWYDASDASTISIDSGTMVVNSWADKTAHVFNLAQSDQKARPAYFSSGGAGNKAFLRFTGTTYLHYTLPNADDATITLYIIIKQVSFSPGSCIYAFRALEGMNGVRPSTNTSHSGQYWGYSQYDGDGQNYADLNTGSGEWQLVKFVFRGGDNNSITKNLLGGYINPIAPEFEDMGSPATLKTEFIQFGLDNFDMSEAILLTGEPSYADDTAVKNYLMKKYQVVQHPVILFFGDSHTAGKESGSPLGDPYFIMASKEKGYDVINMAFSGTVAYPINPFNGSTGKNLADLYKMFDQYIAPNNPYVVFQYGTNDGTSPTNAMWVNNYKSYIQHFIDLGIPRSKIIICSPPYNSNETYNANLANATPVIAGIANSLGVQYCDFYHYMTNNKLDCNAAFTGGDGIHGNETVHRALADLLKTFLQ